MAFSLFPKFFKSDETSTENIYTSNKILDYKTFNTLFENHPDLVFTIDPDREIQFFNQTLSSLFNFNDDKLRFIINQKLLNMGNVKKHVNSAFAGESQNFQFEYIDTHKRSRNFYVTIVPIFNNENHVNAICGIAKDITNYVQYDHQNKIKVIIYTGRELTNKEELYLSKFAHTIIIKNEYSPERLKNELELFLHENIMESSSNTQLDFPSNVAMDLTGKRILLVDDDVRNVFSLTSFLELAGCEVLYAENGLESLKMLDENDEIDLVLMDIMMPEMDGYEAIQQIRAKSQFKELPIIALTSKAMKEDREKCLMIGASDYIAKPVEPDQLISLIKVWVY
ncbi:response regulator [Ureibacillus sp. MALMAid1270]|uniref:response regulator n=1 Tax=Ureibacillus sp. MALMAid1270 TaxID=3411629 RepID=UPI003BA5A7A7